MNEVTLLHDYLFVGAMLFSIGLVGFLCRRNMIIMFLCAEMMLQGVSISLVGWSRFHNNWDGQILTIFILTVAACEAESYPLARFSLVTGQHWHTWQHAGPEPGPAA